MTKRLFILFAGLTCCLFLSAQAPQPQRLQRTPEEEAKAQTMRLIRELGIRDSARLDTIYRMHLKYAVFRQKGLSRAENMERMQAIYAELKQLLTPEEFEQFMNHPAEQPRRPHAPNMAAPNASEPNKQLPTSQPQ